MTAMRVGQGYDVHRLTEGRRLILGGVDVPYDRGLLGHSDADVLLHAIMDALLGAAALGDIGHLFPDTDPKWEGADNVDATVVAQAPKLAPYIQAMRQHIAEDLGIGLDQVSVKATTEEHLGFTGRGEGIAAQAVCLLVR